jgi:hypothetical protein
LVKILDLNIAILKVKLEGRTSEELEGRTSEESKDIESDTPSGLGVRN